MYDKIKFGNKLAVARRQKGLKQSDVCRILGIHQTTYSKIENGKGDINLEQLFVLSSVYGVSILWLIDTDMEDFTAEELLQIENFKCYLKSIRKNI